MGDNESKGLSAKARQNLKRNEFLRRFEWGLQRIPRLEHSTWGAVFDAELVEAMEDVKEIDGKRVLKFEFKYIIGLSEPSWIGLCELIVDSKTAEKIDKYLEDGINVQT